MEHRGEVGSQNFSGRVMGRKRNRTSPRWKKRRSSVRKLRFDSLEDRRLLAGLHVYVFEDANVSGIRDQGEEGFSDRIVFLDVDRDGTLDSGERFARTNLQGEASFDGLVPGTYYPTLFGKNASLAQTEPVRIEEVGTLHTSIPASAVLGWENDEDVWIASNNVIRLVRISASSVIREIGFVDKLIEASVHGTDGASQIYGIFESENGQRFLMRGGPKGLEKIEGSQGIAWKNIHSLRSGVVATYQQGNEIRFASIRSAQAGWGSLIGSLPMGSNLRAMPEWNQFFVETPNASSTTLSLLQIDGNSTSTVGTRTLDGAWRTIATDPSAKFVALKNANDSTSILDLRAGLSEVAVFSESVGSVVFETKRRTVSLHFPHRSQLDTYSTDSWKMLRSERIQGPQQLGTIYPSPNRERWISVAGNGLYSSDLIAVSQEVNLKSESEIQTVLMGQRIRGNNRAPQIISASQLRVIEDQLISIRLGSDALRALDVDNDEIGVFVLQSPQNGQLHWTIDQGGAYLPNLNSELDDRIVFQAFDGRSWSEPVRMELDIEPVDDPPVLQIEMGEIPENVKPGTELGVVTVIDPDRDASYRISVSDSRLLVVDGVLRVAEGVQFDFETESSFDVTFEAIDLVNGNSSFEVANFQVSDENDAPIGLRIATIPIAENLGGVSVGEISVLDVDAIDEEYTWIVSDPRFQIINGKIVLVPDAAVDFESEEIIELRVAAVDRDGQMGGAFSTISLTVVDVNDPPLAIEVDSDQIVERIFGYRIGNATVVDEDTDELYDFSVSDPRFLFEGNSLRLRSNVALLQSVTPSITLEITAISRTNGDSITESKTFAVRANPAPWQNTNNPFDVDGDGQVTALDPLVIINHINNNGVHSLGQSIEGEEGFRYDVNGDGVVSALDVLIVINFLNQFGIPPAIKDPIPESGGKGEGEGEAIVGSLALSTNDLSLASYLQDQDHQEPSPRPTRGIRWSRRSSL